MKIWIGKPNSRSFVLRHMIRLSIWNGTLISNHFRRGQRHGYHGTLMILLHNRRRRQVGYGGDNTKQHSAGLEPYLTRQPHDGRRGLCTSVLRRPDWHATATLLPPTVDTAPRHPPLPRRFYVTHTH